MKILEDIFDFFASIKLAVFVILSLAVISAVGTIYEARYDAEYAQKLIYHSPYMYATLGLLCINLIAVMVDRWPWKLRHTGFILAHIGIIITLIGSWVTRYYGIDGSMRFEVGQTNRFVSVPEQEMVIFASIDGQDFRAIHHAQVDFLLQPPSPRREYVFPLGPDDLKVLEYHHYAVRNTEIVPSEADRDGLAIRFQLINDNVNMTDWVRRDGRLPFDISDLGPARIVMSDGSYEPSEVHNEMIVTRGKTDDSFDYEIYRASAPGQVLRGSASAGDVIQTGWMDLEFRVLRYIPRARELVTYVPQQFPGAFTHPAIKVNFRDEDHWIGLNSILRLFIEDKAYLVRFSNKLVDIGFDITLEEFRIGRYPGTLRAASYESDVTVEGIPEVVNISMNEPLKFRGLTFYQASFEEDEVGSPTASILSVNQDPGRWLKYLGALLIVLGTIFLFYFKRFGIKKVQRPKGKAKNSEDPDAAQVAV